MVARILPLFISFIFLFLLLPSDILAIAMPNPAHRFEVMNLINEERSNKKLNKLKIDNNLCQVASKLAKDKAKNYPEEVDPQLFIDNDYKEYMKNYSQFISLEVTYNDILVKLMKKEKLSFTDEHLFNSFTDPKVGGTSALEPKLISGCVAVSLEDVGQKPFAIFIGGIEKTAFDKFPLSFIKIGLMKLGLMK